jgi:hypothetical protein
MQFLSGLSHVFRTSVQTQDLVRRQALADSPASREKPQTSQGHKQGSESLMRLNVT